MIRHVILFNVKAYTASDQIENALQQFLQLKQKLPGILSIVYGECQFHDEKSKNFFSDSVSHAITIDFNDENALQTFFENPISQPAKQAIINIADGGYEHIIGFDFIK